MLVSILLFGHVLQILLSRDESKLGKHRRQKWRAQWRTIWITNTADHSAISKIFVEEWVRVNFVGGTVRGDYFSIPSPRDRSRPRLHSRARDPNSLDENLAHSSSAFDYWDEMTLREIFFGNGDPLGNCGPHALVAATNSTAVRQEPTYSVASWNTSRERTRDWPLMMHRRLHNMCLQFFSWLTFARSRQSPSARPLADATGTTNVHTFLGK